MGDNFVVPSVHNYLVRSHVLFLGELQCHSYVTCLRTGVLHRGTLVAFNYSN
jgi:hypothetical protein